MLFALWNLVPNMATCREIGDRLFVNFQRLRYTIEKVIVENF